MPEPTRWAAAVLALSVGLTMAACSGESATAEAPNPAVVEQATGSEPPLITLTEQGAARTGIETAVVAAQSPLTVPYRALLYDPNGDTWVYTSPEPLSYVRQPVTVDTIDGEQVILTDGPAAGTEIVTVGVAELYGAELGIGQ
jgi:hypothetical protein